DTWTQIYEVGCDTLGFIYCFGVSQNTPLVITPATGRLAFVSRPTYMGNTGLAAADAICQGEAPTGSNGTFLAFLGTDQNTAGSRFNAQGPTWVRSDGIPLAPLASDVLAGQLVAPLSVEATGAYIPYEQVWTGQPGPTCASWTSSSSQGVYGWATVVDGSE